MNFGFDFVGLVTFLSQMHFHAVEYNLLFGTHYQKRYKEAYMNKLILGMALGACAGLLISEIPEVKKYLDKGKKKMQNIAK